jgi:hypothetical protein
MLSLVVNNALRIGEVVEVTSSQFELSLSFITVPFTPSGESRRSNPQVAENLYTTRNTKKLIVTKTQAVTNFANKLSPDSLGSRGRC